MTPRRRRHFDGIGIQRGAGAQRAARQYYSVGMQCSEDQRGALINDHGRTSSGRIDVSQSRQAYRFRCPMVHEGHADFQDVVGVSATESLRKCEVAIRSCTRYLQRRTGN